MKEVTYRILSNRQIASGTWKMVLEGDTSAVSGSGQFIDIALPGKFLRRPISINDKDGDTLTIVYKVVGKGTAMMSAIGPGESLDALSGLGHGFNPGACKENALLLGGGVGAAPLLLLAKELVNAGKCVTVVLGFNKQEEVMLTDEFAAAGAKVLVCTMDGSAGTKGFVTDAVAAFKPAFDYYYACGPKPMLKAVYNALEADGEISLEERMGCGTGICYGCTCHTSKGPARVCKDGPVFKKEDIIW